MNPKGGRDDNNYKGLARCNPQVGAYTKNDSTAHWIDWCNISLRKKGKVSWELDKCLLLMRILHIPKEEIFTYFRSDL